MDDTNHTTYAWTKEYLMQVLTQGRKPVLTDPHLVSAFQVVDRQDFVEESYRHAAYMDEALPIGPSGVDEKLDSPLVIARMLSELGVKPGYKVLDLGTGSGYVAAILGQIVGATGKVYSVERNQQLAEKARNLINKYDSLGNIEVVFFDGLNGLEAKGPFDAIHVSFAYQTIPEKLLEQLKPGARLVLPLINMDIKLVERTESGFSEKVIDVKEFSKGKLGVE